MRQEANGRSGLPVGEGFPAENDVTPRGARNLSWDVSATKAVSQHLFYSTVCAIITGSLIIVASSHHAVVVASVAARERHLPENRRGGTVCLIHD